MYGRAQTSCRERTQEFQSLTDRLRKSVDVKRSANGDEAQQSAVVTHSEFSKRASKIGLGIHQTSQKLSKLAKLAKRRWVFDDPGVEIQELTGVIKQEITLLNGAVVDLQQLCTWQNESGNISSDTTTHSTTVVDNLKTRLMGATKEFKEVLTMRTENMKIHQSRREMFSSKDSMANPFVRQRPLASSRSSLSAAPPPWASHPSASSSSSSQQQPLLLQQQQQEMVVPAQDDVYMESRAEALHNVESTIHELSNIFTQLATMVSQQGELAIRIDENMEETLGNVEGAQGQLVRYLSGISSNRWLMIKIFFVLIVFLFFFLLFVA